MTVEYQRRLEKHYDELKWLYCELYPNGQGRFEELCAAMEQWYKERNKKWKALDRKREKQKDWYKSQKMLGMMLYIDAFADNISGLEKKLDYLKECNVNYLHLMPFLATPKGKSDGGYAVADYRTVQPSLGTMEDLAALSEKCHDQGMSLCMDFVMNHTSEDHEWAKRALAGEKEYQDRYFFFDNYDIPSEYEKTCPQVFPTTAPGNFTWREDCHKFVMTTFYPYQWDLNYANPVVFNEMVNNMLYLVNQGIDIVRIDAVPYIWKQLGTTCRNLPQVTYHCPHDAYDHRDRLPGRSAARRGCHGAGKGCSVLRNTRETGMPYAVQRNDDGIHLAHHCNGRYPPAETSDGYCDETAEGLCLPELSEMPR